MNVKAWFQAIASLSPEGFVIDLEEPRTLCMSHEKTNTNLDFFVDNDETLRLFVIRDLDFDPEFDENPEEFPQLFYDPSTGQAVVEEQFQLPMTTPEEAARVAFEECVPSFWKTFDRIHERFNEETRA